MDTSVWKRERLELRTGLRLDSENVRLEVPSAGVEADIMEDLFANEAALQLVEGICSVGYLTHEIPIVVKRDGQSVVVEGNRRIAALKAIQNPNLVPDYRHQISALLEKYPDYPRISEVDVMVAPSEDDAKQIIAAIHTGNLRRAWTPARQAAFFQAQIDSGRLLHDLIDRYPTINVRKFVFRAHVVNLFKSADYTSPKLRDYVQSAKFKKGLSTLARVYEAREFLEFTGLKMDEDGKVTKSLSQEQFDAVAAVIVHDMDDGTLNTRTLNTVRDNTRFRHLMAEIKEAANPSGGGESHPADAQAAGGEDAPGSDSSGADSASRSGSRRAGASRRRSTALEVARIKVPDNYGEGFKQVMEELSGTNVDSHPATAFLLIRSALEKGVKSLADVEGIEIKRSNNQNGYVYLRQCLAWLQDHAHKNNNRAIEQVLRNMDNAVYYFPVSGDKLNAVNHNHKLFVTTDQARDMWRSVADLLAYVVNPGS